MTPEELKTEIAGLTEEIRELEQVNATLLAKLTALQSRSAPGVGAVIEAPASGSRYAVRWASGDMLTFGESATVSAWPHMTAMGWKVVA